MISSQAYNGNNPVTRTMFPLIVRFVFSRQPVKGIGGHRLNVILISDANGAFIDEGEELVLQCFSKQGKDYVVVARPNLTR